MIEWNQINTFLNSRSAIWIEGQTYTLAEVAESNFKIDFSTDFARNTVKFIQEWHGGRQNFSQKTSGSTGKPKTIGINREQMSASAWGTVKTFGLNQKDTALLCLDPQFIAGKMMIARALLAGMNLVCVEPEGNPMMRLPDLPEVNFVALVPLQMYNYLQNTKHTSHQIEKIKAIILGGGRIDPKLEKRISEVPVPVFATFGMTETVSHVALRALNGESRSALYTLMPGVEMQQDNRSCLMLRGAVTNNLWVQSNDIVEIVSKTQFQWLGRFDTVINSGGIKVIPEKIEMTISANAPTSFKNNFFIGGFNDSKYGEMVCLFVEGTLAEGIFAELMENLKQCLHATEIPKKYIQVSEFIYTENRKLNRIETIKSCVQSS